MESSKVILITGAAGFLGSWLADEAYKAGYTLIGIDLRAPLRPQIWSAFATATLETVDLPQLVDKHKLSAVYHLAGGASVVSSVKDPFGDFSSLIPGTARLALYLAKEQKQARLFIFSSAAVYGNPQTLPITENTAITPISPYGVHKATAESLLLHYARIFDLQLTVFRIFSVYGPGLKKQLIWDVCQRILSASSSGKNSITLFGTGNESRDFIYVEDLCKASLMILENQTATQFQIYNMASGTESSVLTVANCLARYLQPAINITFDGVVPKGDPVNWRADVSKLSATGFTAQHTIEDGLKKVTDWVKSIADF